MIPELCVDPWTQHRRCVGLWFFFLSPATVDFVLRPKRRPAISRIWSFPIGSTQADRWIDQRAGGRRGERWSPRTPGAASWRSVDVRVSSCLTSDLRGSLIGRFDQLLWFRHVGALKTTTCLFFASVCDEMSSKSFCLFSRWSLTAFACVNMSLISFHLIWKNTYSLK